MTTHDRAACPHRGCYACRLAEAQDALIPLKKEVAEARERVRSAPTVRSVAQKMLAALDKLAPVSFPFLPHDPSARAAEAGRLHAEGFTRAEMGKAMGISAGRASQLLHQFQRAQQDASYVTYATGETEWSLRDWEYATEERRRNYLLSVQLQALVVALGGDAAVASDLDHNCRELWEFAEQVAPKADLAKAKRLLVNAKAEIEQWLARRGNKP